MLTSDEIWDCLSKEEENEYMQQYTDILTLYPDIQSGEHRRIMNNEISRIKQKWFVKASEKYISLINPGTMFTINSKIPIFHRKISSNHVEGYNSVNGNIAMFLELENNDPKKSKWFINGQIWNLDNTDDMVKLNKLEVE